MKTLVKSALIITGLALSLNASAGSQKTDANFLAECKSTVNAQIDSVEKIKVASMNSRRGIFKAKLRVRAGGERSVVSCEIRDNVVALNCVKGNACDTGAIAAN